MESNSPSVVEDKSITIPQNYLTEVSDFISRSLVGKLMKKFEIIEDKSVLKSICKETVYEEMRHLKEILLAVEYGRTMTIFNFKSKDKK